MLTMGLSVDYTCAFAHAFATARPGAPARERADEAVRTRARAILNSAGSTIFSCALFAYIADVAALRVTRLAAVMRLYAGGVGAAMGGTHNTRIMQSHACTSGLISRASSRACPPPCSGSKPLLLYKRVYMFFLVPPPPDVEWC